MARKRSSTARDLIDIVATLPWWVGLLLAALSYVVLSSLAARPLATGGGLNIIAMAAGALRIVVPLVFVVGAVASAFSQVRRRQLFGRATAGDPRGAVAAMDWRDFELLLSEVYRQQGYTVAELGGSGPDGGVDLVLRKDGKKTLVQCKHWTAYSVGVPVVRELLGVMTDRGADAGQVITSGQFTGQAREFAAGHAITLIDGRQLQSVLGKVRESKPASASPAPSPTVERRDTEASIAAQAPGCPTCGQPMVRRTARKGPWTGLPFWGCCTFPKCTGTRSIN